MNLLCILGLNKNKENNEDNQKASKQETLLIFHNGDKSAIEIIEGIIPGLEVGKKVTYLTHKIDIQGVYKVVEKGTFDRLVPDNFFDPDSSKVYIRQICLEILDLKDL